MKILGNLSHIPYTSKVGTNSQNPVYRWSQKHGQRSRSSPWSPACGNHWRHHS